MKSDSDVVIETRGLTKYFGSRCAVDSLDLRVPRGGVFAFLGRNGSGKSTTIRMMLGLAASDRGTASVLGQDSRQLTPELRARVGYMTESHAVYDTLTVAQSAALHSRFYPRWNRQLFSAVVEHFAIDGRTKAKNLSRGERAGLSLALTIAPEPELLVLDDPAIGLDPVARRALLEALMLITRAEGRTVFFSSHLLDDVERVADHVAILRGGVLRASCTIDDFLDSVRRFVVRGVGDVDRLGTLPGMLDVQRVDDVLTITMVSPTRDALTAIHALGGVVDETPLSFPDAVASYLGGRTSMLGFNVPMMEMSHE